MDDGRWTIGIREEGIRDQITHYVLRNTHYFDLCKFYANDLVALILSAAKDLVDESAPLRKPYGHSSEILRCAQDDSSTGSPAKSATVVAISRPRRAPRPVTGGTRHGSDNYAPRYVPVHPVLYTDSSGN